MTINRQLSYLAIFIVFIVAGFLAYKALSVNGLVAMVGDDDQPRIPEMQCNSNVQEFRAFISCENNGFSRYTYVCASGDRTTRTLASSICLAYGEAYTQVMAACQKLCQSRPSPTAYPSTDEPVSTAQASAIPTPSTMTGASARPRVTERPRIPEITPLPSGCWMEQVQCVRAPCEPVLRCDGEIATSIPRPSRMPSSRWSKFGCRISCLSRIGRNYGQCIALCN